MDFVTNSSSTAFIITNKTNEDKTLVDFVEENPQLIMEFVRSYEWYQRDPEYTQENLIESARSENNLLVPGPNHVVFGDESRTLIGQVFDYILRQGGASESFTWKFERYLR